MSRCVIYTRVSTKDQADGYSIAAQRKGALDLAIDKGWVVAGEFSDRGESARTADRPEFKAMLELVARDPSISYLVVHKLDRIARNLEDHAMVRALLRDANCELISVSENLERNASGKLVEGVLAVLAEHYSNNLSQEVKKGMEQKAREGGWPHLAPYGFENRRRKGPGRRGEAVIEPDPERAPLVKIAFELYATGEWPLNKLHQKLTELGLRNRNGKKIARSKVASMLKDRVYLGFTRYGDTEYPGNHEPLVTTELFERVQQVIAEHDRAGVRLRKHDHPLRGVLFCDVCGGRISTMTAKGKFEYFYCLGNHNLGTSCKQPYTPARSMERQVEDLYKSISIPDEVRREIEAELESEAVDREKRRARDARRWSRELEKLANEKQKLFDAYYAEAIQLPEFKAEQARIETERRVAEAGMEGSRAEFEAVREVIDVALKLLDNCFRAYKRAAPPNKRRWNQVIFDVIYVRDRKITRVVYKEPFNTLLGAGTGDGRSLPDLWSLGTRVSLWLR